MPLVTNCVSSIVARSMRDVSSGVLAMGSARKDPRPQGRFKADNGEALLSAALAGLGIAALPDFLIERHLASGALVALLTDHPPVETGFYVVRPSGDFPARKVRALIDIMLEHYGTASDKPWFLDAWRPDG